MYSQTIEKLSKEVIDIREKETDFIYDMFQLIKRKYKNHSGDLSEWEKKLLDQRYEEHLKNPTSGSPWSEVKLRIKNNYKQNHKNDELN